MIEETTKGGRILRFVHPLTGEIEREWEVRTDTQMKEAWQDLQKLIEGAKACQDELKPVILNEIERNSGKPLVYSDGYQFAERRNTYGRKLERADLLEIGMDEDTVMDVMKVDVSAAEKLAAKLVEEKQLEPGSVKELKGRIKESYTKPFPKLEKVGGKK